MYLSLTAANAAEIAALQLTLRLLRVSLTDDELARCAKAEMWSSSMNDPGPDYNELRLFDAAGARFTTKHIDGY
jgi:hypothetical protein